MSRIRVARAQAERKTRITIGNQIQNEVLQFLEREDNSITLPGKNDFKKTVILSKNASSQIICIIYM